MTYSSLSIIGCPDWMIVLLIREDTCRAVSRG